MNPRQPIISPPEDVAENFAYSRKDTEQAIAAIVSEVLKIDYVGTSDDFFALGGQPSQAIRIVSRIRSEFGLDVSTQTLFERPTIAGLVEAVTAAQSSHAAFTRIKKGVHSGAIPLSFAQEQLWFLDQLAGGSPAYNVPDYIVFRGSYDAGAMNRAVHELTRRHEVLRTVFTQNNGQPAQVVRDAVEIALPEVDLSSLRDLEREKRWREITRDEVRKLFDLFDGLTTPRGGGSLRSSRAPPVSDRPSNRSG